MAKSLVGSAGGGKVTVEGLSADVLLTGSTVTVKQGAKTIQQVVGISARTIVFFGGWANGTHGGIYTPVPLYDTTGQKRFDPGYTGMSGNTVYNLVAPFAATKTVDYGYYTNFDRPGNFNKGDTLKFRFDNQGDRCVFCAVYRAND